MAIATINTNDFNLIYSFLLKVSVYRAGKPRPYEHVSLSFEGGQTTAIKPA